MTDLAGKVALVTGASRGIGRAIATTLGRAGADLALAGRNEPLLAQVAGEIAGFGRRTVICAGDLREPDTPSRTVKHAVGALGQLDILVNNAGATRRGEFLALTDADWQDGFALKFFGAVRLCRAAWPHLHQQQGSIIMIAGVGGRTPGPQFAIGGSVNAALLSLTKSLADSGIVDGVQVNAINPGSVWTDRLHERIRVYAERTGVDAETAAARLRQDARITRFGEPEDVANLVAFLASAKGRWMQGSLIDLDGGQTKTL
jgi:NAD(P)-dependent dehydrogenase (short-subunit alcohol dehydrogenase family)